MMNVRRARLQDIPALNRIMWNSSAYDGEYRAMLENYEISPRQIEDDQVFLAEDIDQVLGFYSLIVAPEAELDLMFISDAAQGTGLGRGLFEHMISAAQSLGIAAVKIVSHPPSVGFYERMGARRTGTQAAQGRVTWARPILALDIPPAANAACP